MNMIRFIKAFQERSCGRKDRYDTRSEAKRHAKEINRRYHPKPKLIAYKCLFCPFYHIGHLVTAERRDMMRRLAA